jgi:hypothetical protein
MTDAQKLEASKKMDMAKADDKTKAECKKLMAAKKSVFRCPSKTDQMARFFSSCHSGDRLPRWNRGTLARTGPGHDRHILQQRRVL